MLMPARKPLIAGNWKMHKTHLEAIALVQKLHYLLRQQDYEAAEVAVCPTFTALRSVQTVLEADNIPIRLGAQNCYWEEQGAFTGEISAGMLARLKCDYVIVGHSERRHVFGETDEMVNKKAKAVFKSEMVPIVCVGETLGERDSGRTEDVLETQLRGSLAGLSAEQIGALVVAYEPVWAIGTGRNALPEDANATIGFIRKTIGTIGRASADLVRI